MPSPMWTLRMQRFSPLALARFARLALIGLAAIGISRSMPRVSEAFAAEGSIIQSIVDRISAEASELSKAAHGARPSLDGIANKAMNLSVTMGRLATAIQREPDEASSHADALKQLGRDEINLGMAMISLSTADASTKDDSIANVAAIADDIQNDASSY